MAMHCSGNLCTSNMDCPCICGSCNTRARIQLMNFVLDLASKESERLKPIIEKMLKP